jgi:hypothetical protein
MVADTLIKRRECLISKHSVPGVDGHIGMLTEGDHSLVSRVRGVGHAVVLGVLVGEDGLADWLGEELLPGSLLADQAGAPAGQPAGPLDGQRGQLARGQPQTQRALV